MGLMDSLEDRDCKTGGTSGWEAQSCGPGGRTSVGNSAGRQSIQDQGEERKGKGKNDNVVSRGEDAGKC